MRIPTSRVDPKNIPAAVARLEDAVGVGAQVVTVGHHRLGGRPSRREQADEWAGRFERCLAVGPHDVRRRVTGVRVADPTVVGVDHGHERGEEDLGTHVAQDLGRRVEGDTRRRARGQRGAEHLLAAQRQDPLGGAVAGDVDDHDRDLSVFGDEDVVAVAGHHAVRGTQLAGDRPSVGNRTDIGLELGPQGEHDRGALLDRQAGPLGIDQLLTDPAAHGVDVEREGRELGWPLDLDRRVERSRPAPGGPRPARRSIGRVIQRRISSAATIAPIIATTAIVTKSAGERRRGCGRGVLVARSASIWSFVVSPARLDRTRSKSVVEVPLVISLIAASAPVGVPEHDLACRPVHATSPRPRRRCPTAQRSSGVSSSPCRSWVSSAARARPPVNGSRNPGSPVSAYPRWPVSWSV